jgi:heat shock protein HslJ
MRQEYYYLEALEQAIRFTVNGDQLRLIYNRGRGAINLAQVEEYDEANDANAPMGAYQTTIFVGPQLMDCDGAGQKCLAIRAEGEGRYLPHNGNIAGFDYVEGFQYELKVQAQPVANPEPGAPAIQYTLIEVVRREQVQTAPTPGAVAKGNPLEKTGWQLRAIESAGVETPALDSVAVTLLFGEGSAVGGSSGCNTYVGSYSVDGGAITFSRVVMTLKACADPAVMTQEQTYLRALQAAETIAVFEGQLVLTFDGGNGVLHFVAIP